MTPRPAGEARPVAPELRMLLRRSRRSRSRSTKDVRKEIAARQVLRFTLLPYTDVALRRDESL